MKIILLVLIVLLETVGVELGFVDQANFFNLTKPKEEQVVLGSINLAKIASYPVRSETASELDISAEGYLAVDRASQKILETKGYNSVRPIASLTKIMTAVVALEKMDLGQIIIVDQAVTETTGSKIYILPGTEIRLLQVLKCTLIKSANDCARAIEKGYDQDHETGDFVKQMNKKAKALGMKKTKYVEASGLDERNRSTPRDLNILANYALENKTFREIVRTYQTNITTAEGYNIPVTNTNRLLRTDNDIKGVKTGYLEEAGQCFISLVEQNNRQIVTVLLGASDNNMRFWETRELINGSYSNYRW